MTLSVIEQADSRPIQKQGGKNVGTRRFVVYNDASPITSQDQVFFLFGTGGIPTYGEAFPGALLEATDVDVQRMEGFNDQYMVTWSYADAGTEGETNQPTDVGYVEVSSEVKGEFFDTWRVLTTTQLANLVAAGGSYQYGSPQSSTPPDIGGQHVDWGGESVSGRRRIIELTLGVTLDRRPRLGDYAAFTWRRNNTAFNGAPIGSVVYGGARFSRIAVRRWRASHKFILDSFYHMVQSPYRLQDGKVALGSDGRAESVTYVQPFPDFANLYAIDSNLAGVA